MVFFFVYSCIDKGIERSRGATLYRMVFSYTREFIALEEGVDFNAPEHHDDGCFTQNGQTVWAKDISFIFGGVFSYMYGVGDAVCFALRDLC